MEQSVYNYPLKKITGEPLDLSAFKGRKILLVNTASACGYTPQYAQLQELHENFGDKVAVIGLPCNDFGAQEPGSEQQIAQFCETNFKVTFPLTAKVKITGGNADPLYSFLTSKQLNGVSDNEVKWNFWKFLIDENGKLIREFDSNVAPISDELIKAIES